MQPDVAEPAVTAAIESFIAQLHVENYGGEIDRSIGSRLVLATDNSIYQVLPELVLFPRSGEDLNRIVRAAAALPPGDIAITARGGGTGTNGQSLTSSVVVDVSRHLTRIVSLDVEARTVTVEPGVVLDVLNRHLAPHGLFFPPHVSTASRATIGGMVGTDASGKGSRRYGKTSDHIAGMDVVLSNGETLTATRLSPRETEAAMAAPGLAGRIHREVLDSVRGHRALIEATFPKMNRGLTGYNLRQVEQADGSYCLSYLLAGSEGTLALTRSVTLKLLPLPKFKGLVAIRYADFDAALRDVARLVAVDPLAVEILDDRVLDVARTDALWPQIEAVLGGPTAEPVRALVFVEFAGDDEAGLAAAIAGLAPILSESTGLLDWQATREAGLIGRLWELREKAVGLMAAVPGQRRGVAFVEDTAVPPERLADFVAEFRALLDRHGLDYGMYGHADVGCLHVRPLLDMLDARERSLIRPISEAVVALTRKYGGLLWGEHGRGFRAEFSPAYFGAELYAELCRLKAVFDPNELFNPSKLASSRGLPLTAIDAVPMRGGIDAGIASTLAGHYDRALACNGNGVCFNLDAAAPMCPSYKASGDRTQSPKGRAALLREWARAPDPAVEAATYATLQTCLSCKACSTACPVKVDIPEMKSRFLDAYFQRRRRPLRDRTMAAMENLALAARPLPGLANALLSSPVGRAVARSAFGLVDLPPLVPARRDRSGSAPEARVVLVEDVFTSVFDGRVVDAYAELLGRLGYGVRRIRLRPGGKAQHVLGFRERFGRTARAARAELAKAAASGLPLVGVEPVAIQLHQHEYRALGPAAYTVVPIEAFLSDELASGRLQPPSSGTALPFHLFSHCTEPGFAPKAAGQWRALFAAFGLDLRPVATGCCGMAGMFGHEREHAAMSGEIFGRNWAHKLAGLDPSLVLATGFSCRCQTDRQAGFRPRHPAEALLAQLNPASAPG